MEYKVYAFWFMLVHVITKFTVGGVVVYWLEGALSIGQWEDLRVVGSRPGWSLHCCVVSLDKKLCSTLSLFTQVYL